VMMSSNTNVQLNDLIANVSEGIFIENGQAVQMDVQARNGLIGGSFREITNGRLGAYVTGGSIMFNTREFWKNVTVVGGPATQEMLSVPAREMGDQKGEPAQPVAPARQTRIGMRSCWSVEA